VGRRRVCQMNFGHAALTEAAQKAQAAARERLDARLRGESQLGERDGLSHGARSDEGGSSIRAPARFLPSAAREARNISMSRSTPSRHVLVMSLARGSVTPRGLHGADENALTFPLAALDGPVGGWGNLLHSARKRHRY